MTSMEEENEYGDNDERRLIYLSHVIASSSNGFYPG